MNKSTVLGYGADKNKSKKKESAVRVSERRGAQRIKVIGASTTGIGSTSRTERNGNGNSRRNGSSSPHILRVDSVEDNLHEDDKKRRGSRVSER